MKIEKIIENKKQFLDLLLLADEQENMIDKYLASGDLFALYDGDLKSVCVVVPIDSETCELKNIATYEKFQGKGYGKALIKFISDFYKNNYKKILVGTGEIPWILSFYESCGFEKSYRVNNFFTDNYDHPMFDGGIQLVDMIYLKKNINENKMNKETYEKNREAWNEAMTYHQKARGKYLRDGFGSQNFTTFTWEGDDILIKKFNEIGLENKIVAQLPCNNGRELLSIVNSGAKKGIGFDISDTAILEANELKTISNLNAEFHRTNILDIDDTFNNSIDFIYISEGSFQWFPSLNDYFKIVAKLLKPNGKILIHEIHPFAYFFDTANDLDKDATLDDFISYFEKGPYSYKNGLDYVGQIKYDAKECCWYMHKISDIINAIIHNSIEIESIEEYNLEIASKERMKNIEKFPLSYMINCRKRGENASA